MQTYLTVKYVYLQQFERYTSVRDTHMIDAELTIRESLSRVRSCVDFCRNVKSMHQ